MSSIITNNAAMSAGQVLNATDLQVLKTSNELSTGLRVSSAKDNPSYWSIATNMRDQLGALQAVDDGLNITTSVIAVTNGALTKILDLVQGIKNDLITAQTPGTDRTAIQADLAAKQKSIIATATAANFNGVNWLVTKVTGTTTSNVTNASTSNNFNSVANGNSQGTAFYTSTTSVDEHVTQTLGSTSSSDHISSNDETTTYVSVARQNPGSGNAVTHTTTQNSDSETTTGDSTGYQNARILTGVDQTGATTSEDVNIHPLELFKSFTGIDTSTGAAVDSHYDLYLVPGQSDVLDQTFSSPNVDLQKTSVLTFDITAANSSDLTTMTQMADDAVARVIAAMSFLGGLSDQIQGQESFNAILSDAIKSGIGSMVDADLDQVSTRAMALQTQQQLGIQSLAIANDNAKEMLKLFGG